MELRLTQDICFKTGMKFVCSEWYCDEIIGSVVPHQGVSWCPLAGFNADQWTGRFSTAQLNHMAGNGVLLITKHADGYICARHAVTTSKSPLGLAHK